MKTENKNKVVELLNNSYNGPEIDFNYMLKDEDFENLEQIRDILEENGAFDVEIIYYSNAIEYLSQHDASLKESLSIAAEMGFAIENLSSEILASLLASQNARESFNDIDEDEVNELIIEILTQEEEEEEEEL